MASQTNPASAAATLNIDTYEDRLKLLDLIAAAYPVPPGFLDPMQGDRIQTQWQLTSGRGANPWWNRINYTLTVWRMQALQSRGEFPNVGLQGNQQVPIPDAVRQDLFAYYDAVRAIQTITEAAEEQLQRLFWTVHEHTVVCATQAAFGQEPSLLPGEKQFALGWGKVMVRVLADANFSTDKHFVGLLNADCLPQRLCVAADINPLAPSDLPAAQRATVLMITGLLRDAALSPIFTPVPEAGAAVLNEAIEIGVDLTNEIAKLRRHLRGTAGLAVGA